MEFFQPLFAAIIAFFVGVTGGSNAQLSQERLKVSSSSQMLVENIGRNKVPEDVATSQSVDVITPTTFYVKGVKLRDKISAQHSLEVYVLKSNQVYFDRNKNNDKAEVLIEGADPESFTVLLPETPTAEYKDKLGQLHSVGQEYQIWTLHTASYAKDKNYLYIDGKKADNFNFDSKTFVLLYNSLNNIFFKDKDFFYKGDVVSYAYLISEDNEGIKNPNVVEGIDPLTILNVDNAWQYYKDKDAVYFYETKIENADPVTFTWIETIRAEYDSLWMKDKKNIYVGGKVVKGADVATFEVIQIVPDMYTYIADGTSSVVENNFKYVFNVGKDKNHVYDQEGNAIPGLDPVMCTTELKKCFKNPPYIVFQGM